MADNIAVTEGSGKTVRTLDVGGFQHQVVVTANSAGTVVDPVAQVAHDAADSGEPVKIGAKAETALSGVTLVADGDRTNLYAGADGVLFVRPHTGLEDIVSERDSITSGTSTAFGSGMAAPGANIRLYVTSVAITNTSTTDTFVDLQDGASGTVLWTLPCPQKGGAIQTFDPPLKLTANTALAYQVGTGSTTVYISANGFKSKI